MRGFIGNNALVSRSSLIENLAYFHGQQLLFPNISSPPGVTLTKVTFAARRELDSVSGVRQRQTGNNLQYPELQIWRRGSSNFYHKNMSFGGSVAPSEVPGVLNLYEYTIDPAVSLQAGDILGVYQPTESNSVLSLTFIQDFGVPTHVCSNSRTSGDQLPTNCELSNTGSFTSLPLVTVEVLAACKLY